MPRTARRGEPPIFTNAGRRFPPEVLSDAEVRALLDACGEGSPTHARNRALIAVLYRSGLRVSEALALHPKDLDPATGAVRVLNGKGGRARTTGLDPGAFRLVGAWMRLRAGLGLDARHPLFCTLRGDDLPGIHVPVRVRATKSTFSSSRVQGGDGARASAARPSGGAALHAAANDAGVAYPSELCGRRWL